MKAFPSSQEITRFRGQVTALMGLYFDESKFSTLAKVLHNRMLAHEAEPGNYLDWLNTRSRDEIGCLARELTVTETYFLRNIDQFHALAEVVLPQRLAVREGEVQLLSAGCASGEEPYSMAITVRERCPQAVERIAISAIDLNPAMLQRAAKARYSNWSLRDISDALRQRWFSVDGDSFRLNDAIRNTVRFASGNLTEDSATFWIEERFDVVFCRNVLMYFSVEQARNAIRRIARALAPGGFLFLGHAETLRGLSNDFHLCHSNDTFYYQRKDQLADTQWEEFPDQTLAPRRRITPSTDTSWVDAIQLASERIHALRPDTITPMQGQSAPDAGLASSWPASAIASAPTAAPPPNLQQVLDSLHNGNYRGSLGQIDNLAPAHANDPDVLLLKAVSLCQSGALESAELACEELLACDEFNAGAHYVMAMCREGLGDLERAVAHDQTAIYLDPGFAMPRLHLGLLARRQHNRSSARNQLEQALLLLQREDPARVLLFGGGFKREALLDLCNAELTALGELQ